ncbi:hypothetical protein G6F68_020194 [Rhizopus microsporus]|nr:hypothetical protein G6F68_020194 [Rhizopus microsporus]
MHAHVQPLGRPVDGQQVVAAGPPAAVLARRVQQRPRGAEADFLAAEVGAVDVAVVGHEVEGIAHVLVRRASRRHPGRWSTGRRRRR